MLVVAHFRRLAGVLTFLSIAVALLVLPSFAQLSSRDTVVTLDRDGSRVTLTDGQRLIVKLEGNPGTGAGWDIERSSSLLHLVGDLTFEVLSPTKVESGAPALQVFTFLPVHAGEETLTRAYRRPIKLSALSMSMVWCPPMSVQVRALSGLRGLVCLPIPLMITPIGTLISPYISLKPDPTAGQGRCVGRRQPRDGRFFRQRSRHGGRGDREEVGQVSAARSIAKPESEIVTHRRLKEIALQVRQCPTVWQNIVGGRRHAENL